jgi:hypothetical protein
MRASRYPRYSRSGLLAMAALHLLSGIAHAMPTPPQSESVPAQGPVYGAQPVVNTPMPMASSTSAAMAHESTSIAMVHETTSMAAHTTMPTAEVSVKTVKETVHMVETQAVRITEQVTVHQTETVQQHITQHVTVRSLKFWDEWWANDQRLWKLYHRYMLR